MGVDLTIMPESFDDTSFHLLHLERDRSLWGAIEAAKIEHRADKPVRCFVARGSDGDPAYGELETTPYGDPLTWARAEDLRNVMSGGEIWGNSAWIYAALQAMKPDHKIYLYWH